MTERVGARAGHVPRDPARILRYMDNGERARPPARGSGPWTRPAPGGPIQQLIPILARRTWRKWRDEHATRQGAGLAFYALFSLAPAVMVTTWALDPSATGNLWLYLMPAPLLDTTEELVASTQRATQTRWFVLAVFSLIYGPLRGFLQLQATLNELWGIRAVRGPGPVEIVRRKLLAFASVGLTVVLLFGGALVSGLLAKLGGSAARILPDGGLLLGLGHRVYPVLLITLLVTAIYRTLPDARVAWRDALLGGLFTALLWMVGREILTMYLQATTRTLSFGPAAPVVAILLFTYYSAQVLLFGASFAWVIADASGRPIEPGVGAVRLTKVTESQAVSPPSGADLR